RELGDRRAGGPAEAARVLRNGSLAHAHAEGGRAMNAMTARGLSLAAVVAVWTAISEMARVNLSLWPVLVGLACAVAAGGGVPGLQRTLAGTISGVVWALVAHAATRALGGQDLVQALVLGAAVFAMVLQAQFLPLLSYTAGALAGAGVAMGLRAVTIEGGVRVAAALALAADPTAAQRARQAVRLLERALGEIRNFIGAFRPPGFERRELGQIIEGLAVQHETLTEQAVELELPGELGDCALPTKIAIYRI